MARDSDAVIHLLAGPEIGVASTKAYLAQLVNMLLLFALHLNDLKWMLPKEKREESVQELRLLPNLLEQMLEDTSKIQEVAKQIKDCNSVLFLGRTYNYPTALEGALKLKKSVTFTPKVTPPANSSMVLLPLLVTRFLLSW